MLVEAVRISKSLAMAMLSRGYGTVERTTPLNQLHMSPLDVTLGALSILGMLAAIYLSPKIWDIIACEIT